MKYLILLTFLISTICHSGNHKNHDHDHNDHKDNHGHNHKEDTDMKKPLKAHQHGVGILNIVKEKDILVFEFELPGYDVVGFEYRAKKKDDIKKVKKAINILSDYRNMIEIDSSGKCKEKLSKADLLAEGNHTEFRSSYEVVCSNISKIKKIKINYFENFKNGEKLEVKIVSEEKSSSLELDAQKSILETENYF